MKLDELTIGEAKSLASMFGGGCSCGGKPGCEDHGIAIVVLDRGFVYVGRVKTDASWCYITDAKNIRVWGTTKGLGQLANEGPNSNTKLDPVGEVRAPSRAVISVIAVKEAAWKSVI